MLIRYTQPEMLAMEHPVLIIDDPTTWPEHLVEALSQKTVVNLVSKHKHMDRVVNEAAILSIMEEIEALVATMDVAAFHCTKELAHRPFSQVGLRILNFAEHHPYAREVLVEHGVDDSLLDEIDRGFAQMSEPNAGRREGHISLCLTRSTALDSGTEDLFRFFGGEAVYRSFERQSSVHKVLAEIGKPVVVELCIPSGDLDMSAFYEQPFARTLISHFANSINPEFVTENLEGRLNRDVRPQEIVEVHVHDDFVAKFGIKS